MGHAGKLRIITQENESQRDSFLNIRALLKSNSQAIKFKPHFVYSSISCPHLNCFHILAVMNSAAINLYAQGFLWTYVFTSLGFTYTYTHTYAYKQTHLLGHQVTVCLHFWEGLGYGSVVECFSGMYRPWVWFSALWYHNNRRYFEEVLSCLLKQLHQFHISTLMCSSSSLLFCILALLVGINWYQLWFRYVCAGWLMMLGILLCAASLLCTYLITIY